VDLIKVDFTLPEYSDVNWIEEYHESSQVNELVEACNMENFEIGMK
jgi:hypothetical protein